MKKTAAFILLAALVFCAVIPTYAQKAGTETTLSDGTQIIYCDDGGYIIISPATMISEVKSPDGTRATVTQTKTQTKKDSGGNVEWKYTLTGTFSYTYGVSASCTGASYSKTIYDSVWSFSNGSATASGATATGNGTFTKKVLFITVDTVNVHLTLTCDKYGNVT